VFNHHVFVFVVFVARPDYQIILLSPITTDHNIMMWVFVLGST